MSASGSKVRQVPEASRPHVNRGSMLDRGGTSRALRRPTAQGAPAEQPGARRPSRQPADPRPASQMNTR